MLVWTHEDLFHFPSITTAQDFLDIILDDSKPEISAYQVALQTFPQDEAILAKLRGLFPDPAARTAMLGDDGLPNHTWICSPQFVQKEPPEVKKCEQLKQQILATFAKDFTGPIKVPCPSMPLLEACVKRYCDQISGRQHEHGYRGREEDWWLA
ncbi:MAG: hypothetical protein WAN46_12235 [Gammaproteobacteria bacterium]